MRNQEFRQENKSICVFVCESIEQKTISYRFTNKQLMLRDYERSKRFDNSFGLKRNRSSSRNGDMCLR